MSAKMITIGARVPQEDAEFISQLQIEGATTPSDKVRAIIAEARRRTQGSHDYRACYEQAMLLLAPMTTLTRQLEMQHGIHSEVLSRTLDWLPDMVAFVMSSSNRQSDMDEQTLIEIERGMTDRVFRLIESILQMGVTQRCPCYDKDAILDRVEPVLDLVRVIEKYSRS